VTASHRHLGGASHRGLTLDQGGFLGRSQREQAYFERAIRENLDLTAHMDDAVNSMRIVAAADLSFRTGKTIEL
jgi:deoxyinosine 3'endonuclease (endonuclease V)